MRQRLRSHLTFANVVSVTALFVALGGTAAAAVIITSNSEVAKDTISGHKPPTGAHSNIIKGSVNATDLASGAVTAAKIKAPEAWHQVAPGSDTQNLCADASTTAVFCSVTVDFQAALAWRNYGAPFATAGFYKDQLGIVHLKGLVSNDFRLVGTIPSSLNIFRLPPAYAPANQRVFPTVGRDSAGQEVAQGRIDVQPDGLVVLVADCAPSLTDCSADGEYITLEGISFRPDE
jgi:hypothetical protein